MGIKYDDLDSVLVNLRDAQEADHDIRTLAREAVHFVHKRDGQWEPEILKAFSTKPRYTFDLTTPIIDQIHGEMENADFTLRVRPSSGQASKETAQTFDGLIRNIRNISNAEHVFNASARMMVTSGMDGWEVVQAYTETDTFDQDLIIKKIHNWVDRVWFDPSSEEQDHSDANWVIVLQTILRDDFHDQFGEDKNPQSVTDDRRSEVYFQKPDWVVIGRILYKKPETIELVQMSNGAVYRDDEDFQKVKDELAAAGVVEVKRRPRDTHRVYSRLFSGSDWLTEPERTVFDDLPVCATYGNFTVSENKRVTKGIVEYLMDPQRVFNYSESRKVEETALSPREKLMMTPEQAKGHSKSLSTLNNNTDPVQKYNHVDGQTPPFKVGASQVNPGLSSVSDSASNSMNAIAGMFGANMGDNPGLQSGVAIDLQINKGDNGTVKWFSAMEMAICYTGKVLINSIPRVYDATRQVRLLQEDGSFEMATLNQPIEDRQTGEVVVLNDLTKGVYDVVCDMGPAFKSRQKETASAIAEIAAIDPAVMQIGSDVFLNNTNAPGVDIVAARRRQLMINEGLIPEDQLTDEERARIAEAQAIAAQQPPAPDPAMVLAEAEMVKAQADVQAEQNKQAELQIKAYEAQVKQQDIQLKQGRLELDAADKGLNQLMEQQSQLAQELKDQISALESLKNVTGADGIMSPDIMALIQEQVNLIAAEQMSQLQIPTYNPATGAFDG